MLRQREFYVALLAIVAGAAALWLLRDLQWGTAERVGPAALPGLIAIALVLFGAWHLARMTLMPSPQRQARVGYAWLDLVPWAVLVALMVISAAAGARPSGLLLQMGPPEYLAFWLLVLSLTFAATWIAERGALSRLAIPMLLGLLVPLGNLDIISGTPRMWETEPEFVHGVLAGALVVALRLPVVSFLIGFTLALQIEEQLRRSLLISRGDPLIFITRPISAALLGASVIILIGVVIGRFKRRRFR